MRILVVEDDVMIGESLQTALRSDGYAIDWAADGEEALLATATHTYDLILLDLGLPKVSGLTILKTLRAQKNAVPILILSARDEVSDRVAGLDEGADDYLIKPFALKELEARIRTLLRRKSGRAEPVLGSGDLTLNPATHTLTYKALSHVLSPREYALMAALLEKPDNVLSRPQLEEKIYGWNEEVSSNSVEVHIHQLRRKFGNELIRNIRGVGYQVMMP